MLRYVRLYNNEKRWNVVGSLRNVVSSLPLTVIGSECTRLWDGRVLCGVRKTCKGEWGKDSVARVHFSRRLQAEFDRGFSILTAGKMPMELNTDWLMSLKSLHHQDAISHSQNHGSSF
jgi:hypothetical protein